MTQGKSGDPVEIIPGIRKVFDLFAEIKENMERNGPALKLLNHKLIEISADTPEMRDPGTRKLEEDLQKMSDEELGRVAKALHDLSWEIKQHRLRRAHEREAQR